MARIGDLFAGRSLDAILRRARGRLGAGDFPEAERIVTAGLARYPDASALQELKLSLDRFQARSRLQQLSMQCQRSRHPRDYQQLIGEYQAMQMHEEAREAAERWLKHHPESDTPYLVLGELDLRTYLANLQQRDGHAAHDHLVTAARLNPDAIKPRLLLAEFYFCLGAYDGLRTVVSSLRAIAGDDPNLEPVFQLCERHARDQGDSNLDGRLAQTEVDGALVNEPTSWPLSNFSNRDGQVREQRIGKQISKLVRSGAADEVVVLRRNGSALAHVAAAQDEAEARRNGGKRGVLRIEEEADAEDRGLKALTRGVAGSVARQVRDMDMGDFQACSIEGPYGLVVIGAISNVVTGARRKSRPGETEHLWDRLSVALDGSGSGGAA